MDGPRTIEVALRIAAPASVLFEFLANPRRHADFDGSGMLRSALGERPVAGVGDTFTIAMHRLGRDYQMINHVVDFEKDRRIFWEPAPGDLETAGGDPSKIGVPAGYRWGFVLDPEGDDVTRVTEVFDCGPDENRWILETEDGSWINGATSVRHSMTATLERLAAMATEPGIEEMR